MKKRFVSAALAAVMALSMTACGSSNSAAETTAADTEAAESQAEESTAEEAKTTDGGTLIVGFDQDFPPMGFVGDNGEYTGGSCKTSGSGIQGTADCLGFQGYGA